MNLLEVRVTNASEECWRSTAGVVVASIDGMQQKTIQTKVVLEIGEKKTCREVTQKRRQDKLLRQLSDLKHRKYLLEVE